MKMSALLSQLLFGKELIFCACNILLLFLDSQLEAIVRISESLAKMTLSAITSESHIDEAIRLFNISTLHAVQATPGIYLFLNNSS